MKDLFQVVQMGEPAAAALEAMLAELGEPKQTLSPASPRPVVVHEIVAQMSLVVGGVGLALLAEEEIVLQRGTLLIVLPGCHHAFHVHGGELCLMHWHWPTAALRTDRRVVVERHEFSCDQFGPERPA